MTTAEEMREGFPTSVWHGARRQAVGPKSQLLVRSVSSSLFPSLQKVIQCVSCLFLSTSTVYVFFFSW